MVYADAWVLPWLRIGSGEDLECVQYALLNPSFEEVGGWTPHKGGFNYTDITASDGERSVSVTDGGAGQTITLPAG